MSKKSLLDIARDAANKRQLDEEDIVLLGVEFLKDRGFVFAKIAKLESELADLREKYRWRKQGEEPAPENEKVEVATVGVFGGTCCIGAIGVLLDLDSLKDCYWRPLDLPEEETK